MNGNYLTDEAANDLRMMVDDVIVRLTSHRKRLHLEILQIQLDRAFAQLDRQEAEWAEASRKAPRRKQSELAWKLKSRYELVSRR